MPFWIDKKTGKALKEELSLCSEKIKELEYDATSDHKYFSEAIRDLQNEVAQLKSTINGLVRFMDQQAADYKAVTEENTRLKEDLRITCSQKSDDYLFF